MTKTAQNTAQNTTKALAQSLGIDLRQILLERERELSKFREYVDSWDDAVKTTEDPLEFTEAFVVERAMEMVEGVTHTHSGGTGMMLVRAFRTRALQLLTAGRS